MARGWEEIAGILDQKYYQPQDISMLRSRVMLGMNTLMSRFDGIVDPLPLHQLIRKNVNDDYPRYALSKSR
jgi:hypothetical protein